MGETKHVHQRERAVDGEHIPPDHVPYWRRAHRDWRLWVGLIFMLVAIGIYVFTVDLSLAPGRQPQQSVPNADGK